MDENDPQPEVPEPSKIDRSVRRVLDDMEVGEFTYYNLGADQAALESRNSWPLVDAVARTLEASGDGRAPRTDDFMRAKPRRRVVSQPRSPSAVDVPAAPVHHKGPKVDWPVLASGVLDWREPAKAAAAGGTEENARENATESPEEKTHPGPPQTQRVSHETTPESPLPEGHEIHDSRRPRRDTE